MKNTKRISFYRPRTVSIKEFEAIVRAMKDDLEAICRGSLDEKEIREYAHQLLKEAKPLKNRDDMLFWGLGEPDSMPSDARVDFFYTPSYLATAFLIKSILIVPDLLDDEQIRTQVAAALLGTTARGFAGHGYDHDRGRVETIKILASAGAREFILENPEICPNFRAMYRRTIDDIKEMIASGAPNNKWGDNFIEVAKEVIRIDKSMLCKA